jgi:hypothetical protein
VIVLDRRTRDADRADHLAGGVLQRQSAVAVLDVEQRAAGKSGMRV